MIVSDGLRIGEAIELIVLVMDATDERDWTDQVRFLPF